MSDGLRSTGGLTFCDGGNSDRGWTGNAINLISVDGQPICTSATFAFSCSQHVR